MKIKKIGALCKSMETYRIYDQHTECGVQQWLGNDVAWYKLCGMPYMEVFNLSAMFDISEKVANRYRMTRVEGQTGLCMDDWCEGEKALKPMDRSVCISAYGREMMALDTSDGIVFVDKAYLAPLDDQEYLGLYERRASNGTLYIAAKVGMELQAIITPVNLVNPGFVQNLQKLAALCKMKLDVLEVCALEVDPATGEVKGPGE